MPASIMKPAQPKRQPKPERYKELYEEWQGISDFSCRDSLKSLGPLQLIETTGTYLEITWDYLMKTHHPQGYRNGARLKQMVLAGNRPLALLGWGNAALTVSERDHWVGFQEALKPMHLKQVANNMRFLILPGVEVKHLASRVLGLSLRGLARAWKQRTGQDLYLAETYVDRARYRGTCYRASNWIRLGKTKGYGRDRQKVFVYHGEEKEVYVYVINPLFREKWGVETRKSVHQLHQKDASRLQGLTEKVLNHASMPEHLKADLQNMLLELGAIFADSFSRRSQQELWLVYLMGLLMTRERKDAENIALTFGIPVATLQQWLSRGAWDENKLLACLQSWLMREVLHQEEELMIAVDGCGYRKKGSHSPGVGRMYLGETGKVDNGQMGVFASLVGSTGTFMVDAKLYLPEKWLSDEYAGKRKACKIPENTPYASQQQIALQLIHQQMKRIKKGVRVWIGGDSLFGSSAAFRRGLPENVLYLLDIRENTLVHRCGKPEKSGRITYYPKAMPATEWAETCMEWNTYLAGRPYQPAKPTRIGHSRVVLNATDEEVWLIARQWEDGTIRYAISNAPADMAAEDFLIQVLKRWEIEVCFRECKQRLGLSEYDGRAFPGWHRHMWSVMILHAWLRRQAHRHRQTNANWSLSMICTQLSADEVASKKHAAHRLAYLLVKKAGVVKSRTKKLLVISGLVFCGWQAPKDPAREKAPPIAATEIQTQSWEMLTTTISQSPLYRITKLTLPAESPPAPSPPPP